MDLIKGCEAMARGKLKLLTFKERLEQIVKQRNLVAKADDPLLARELGFDLNATCFICGINHKTFEAVQPCILKHLLASQIEAVQNIEVDKPLRRVLNNRIKKYEYAKKRQAELKRRKLGE